MSNDLISNRRGGLLPSIGLWVVKALAALVFLYAAGLKLSGSPKMVAEFNLIGLGQSFRYVTGAVEGAGALLLLWPRSAFLGALVLMAVIGGALLAQITVLHHDLIHVFVLGGLVIPAAWLERPAVLRRKA